MVNLYNYLSNEVVNRSVALARANSYWHDWLQ
jgi:hypothetical protein